MPIGLNVSIHFTKTEAEMDFSSINWLAVVACVVASMIIGSVWFAPKTFFPIWWKAIGKSENDSPSSTNMGMVWGLIVFSAFVQAVFMSLMVHAMGSMTPGGSTLLQYYITRRKQKLQNNFRTLKNIKYLTP